MRSLTNDNRGVIKDLDLDFIHYSLSHEAIIEFVKPLNILPSVRMELIGNVEELMHQDYRGKRIYVKITDTTGYSIKVRLISGYISILILNKMNIASTSAWMRRA